MFALMMVFFLCSYILPIIGTFCVKDYNFEVVKNYFTDLMIGFNGII